MEYLIRDFQDSDIDDLIRLCARHAAYELSDYDESGKASRLKTALLSSTPELHCWIVIAKNLIVGYTTFTFDFSTWHARHYLHVDCIYIEDDFRGHGIGSVIMNRLINVARDKECVNVQWQTPVFNKKAIRFYEKINAQGIDKKRFYISIPEHFF
jgi:GNAT superfamily N-acetyltransferase